MNQLLDERDLQQIMQNHTDDLLRLAFLFVKDWSAAEDIVQDVFLTFYQDSELFEERSLLKTYLSKITMNKCIDYLKSWRYRMQILTISFSSKPTKNRNIEQDEKLELAEAVLQLPKYREIIIYYYFEKLSILEVAEHLKLSDNIVKTRLCKARTLLKDELKNNQWEVLLHE